MAICRTCSSEVAGTDRYCRKCGIVVAPVFEELEDTRRFSPSAAHPFPQSEPPYTTNPLNAPLSAAPKAFPPLRKSAQIAKLPFRPHLVWALIVVILLTFLGLGMRIISNLRRAPDWAESSGPLTDGAGPNSGVRSGKGGGADAGRGAATGGSDMGLSGGRGIEPMTASLRPTIIYRESAKYTEEARQNKVQGTVALQVVFHVSGAITEIRVVRGLPHGLTEEAIVAAKKIRFNPAERNGVPVSVRGILEFSFNLY